MAIVATANLVGITGIVRRLVLDGALEEQPARDAMRGASAERKTLSSYLIEKRLVTPAQLAAANSIEFGVPLFDVSVLDPNQSAIKLVNEELVRKHNVLPLFRRGNRLFVGIADPTNTQALDEIKFQSNLAVEAILVDEEKIHRTIEQWLATADALNEAMGGDEGMDNLSTSGGDDYLAAAGDSGVDAKGDDTPVVKFINKVLVDAIRKAASDI